MAQEDVATSVHPLGSELPIHPFSKSMATIVVILGQESSVGAPVGECLMGNGIFTHFPRTSLIAKGKRMLLQ